MTRRSIAGAMLLILLGSVAARAAPATPEEAKRLAALIEDYVGHTAPGQPSAVTVVPHGEGYTATLDITRMLGFTAAFGVDITAGDLVSELTPDADGQWQVAIAGFPPIGVSGKDLTMSFTVNNYKFDGRFDPAIQAFSTSTGSTRGSTTHVRGQQEPLDIAVSSDNTATTKATAAGPGTIDVTSTSSNKDVDYRITQAAAGTGDAGKAAKDVARVQVSAFQSSLTLHGQPAVALNDLWRFLVAHPSRAKVIAAQSELKTRLKAVIPLASSAAGTASLSKVTVATEFGAFALDTFDERYDINKDGQSGNTIGLRLAGLTLPDRLVPAWATPLIPTRLDYNQSYGPVHASDALTMAVDDLDLAADKPLTEEQQADILQAIGADHMTVTLAPSTIATALMTVTVHGEARIDKPKVVASATVAATGLDKTLAAVRAAAPGDPNGMQAVTMLMAAKALGKAEGPDSYSWVIAQSPNGEVTINGNALPGRPGPDKVKPRKTGVQP